MRLEKRRRRRSGSRKESLSVAIAERLILLNGERCVSVDAVSLSYTSLILDP